MIKAVEMTTPAFNRQFYAHLLFVYVLAMMAYNKHGRQSVCWNYSSLTKTCDLINRLNLAGPHICTVLCIQPYWNVSL